MSEYVTPRQTNGIDWAKIFRDRPDLNPPGYDELIEQLYPQEDQNHEK